jgi:hypothetical protein
MVSQRFEFFDPTGELTGQDSDPRAAGSPRDGARRLIERGKSDGTVEPAALGSQEPFFRAITKKRRRVAWLELDLAQ